MLNTTGRLVGSTITATDGAIGHVKAAFFDDQAWTIRYLVIEAGSWLTGRLVLISPYSVKRPVGDVRNIDVSLTREQVKMSPDIDTHQPVSRQHERELLSYYAYPEYWEGGGLWALESSPMLTPALPSPLTSEDLRVAKRRELLADDVHLRSSVKVAGYEIQASDDSIGHVEDFIFDDDAWTIRYLLVDTRNWWPGGRKVLIGTHWIDRIDWATKMVHVKLTREQVRSSPDYHDPQPIDRDYEKRLHAAYDRQGYWD